MRSTPPGYDPAWSDLHGNAGLDGAIVGHLDRLNAAGHHTSSSCQGGYRRRVDRRGWTADWKVAAPGWVWTYPHLGIRTNTLAEAQELARTFRGCFDRETWAFFGGMLSVDGIVADWSHDCWFDARRGAAHPDVRGLSDVEARGWWDMITDVLCVIPSVAPVITSYTPAFIHSWAEIRTGKRRNVPTNPQETEHFASNGRMP